MRNVGDEDALLEGAAFGEVPGSDGGIIVSMPTNLQKTRGECFHVFELGFF